MSKPKRHHDPNQLKDALGHLRLSRMPPEVAGHSSASYLGDISTVEDIVRLWLQYVLDKLPEMEAPDDQIYIMQRAAKKSAAIFLGKTRSHIPIRNWNQPGAIDVFMAKWMGSSEKTPEARMEHAFVLFYKNIIDIAKYASDESTLDEQWIPAMQDEIRRFIWLLVGVDPPTQSMMEVA